MGLLLSMLPLLSPLLWLPIVLAVAFADVSNYKDTIHTANELPLGEIHFLILYLLA